jgi:antitoxin CptB
MDAGVESGRLRWRCRRGTRELDVLLERYLDGGWTRASSALRASFEQLLELPDPVLSEWLVWGFPPPRELEEIVDRIRAAPGSARD